MMDFTNILIKFISKHFRLKALPERWQAIKNLGNSKSLEIPSELVALNIDVLSRSYYNISAIQPNLDWIWPYWILKQYDPEDKSFLPSSYLSINLTHRNWTAVSSLNSDFEAIIDEKGLLTPLFDGWSIEYWIKKGDDIIIPSKVKGVKQHLVNRVPIIKTDFYKKGFQISSEVLMTENHSGNYVVANYLVENIEYKSAQISFFLSIRPYNPESIIPIFSIEYIKKLNAFIINNKDYIYLEHKPARVICSNQKNRDCFFNIKNLKKKSIYAANDKGGLCTAFVEYNINISNKKEFTTRVIIPYIHTVKKEINKLFLKKYSEIKTENITLWQEKKKTSLMIHTPDSKINRAFEYCKQNLLVLVDKTEIPPGPFTYHTMWFRDASYSITALLKLGFYSDVKRIISQYFKKQQSDGYFMSQDGEWDSNGQALWTIAQYYFFTDDESFIRKNYNKLLKAVNWIFKQSRKTMTDKNDLHYGLLPPGFSAEHFGPANYYYWDNFWAFAGVSEFIKAAKRLNYNVNKIEKDLTEYKKNIITSIKRFQKKEKEKYIPSSPYRKKDSSIIGSAAAIYPLQIFDVYQEDISNTLKIITKNYMKKGSFF